jgi:hypothetical protein
MLTYALVILSAAVLGGFVLASNVLRGRFAPWAVSIGHALLGMTGIGILVWVVWQGAQPARVSAALGLLVAAALGGFTLASMHLRGSLSPRTVVYVHAAVAIVGVLVLFSVVVA